LKHRSRMRLTTAIGMLVLTVDVLCAIFAPLLALNNPVQQHLQTRLLPPMWCTGGNRRFPLGTDQLGRCLFSRIVYGARTSILVATIAVGISATVGTCLGLIAGYFRGITDSVISRWMEIQLSIPYVLLAVIVVLSFGPSFWTTTGVLCIRGWVVYARLVRGQVLALREREYVLASKSIGASNGWIMLRHILPNVASLIIVVGTLEFANMILLEGGLSFLGLGIPPPTPTWGSILSDGRDYIAVAWWISTFPGIALTASALGANLLGDWLRSLLDPTQRHR